MKKFISALLALTAVLLAVFSFASCKSEKVNIKNKEELIQYLKERNLYVNEPIAAEGEI